MSRWADTFRTTFYGPEGAGGRVVLSWVLAGGICGGGLLVGALALLGRGSPGLHLLLTPVLFLVGSVLGVAHGFILALAGRSESATRAETARRGLIAVGVSLLLLPLSWLISSSIAVGTALRVELRASWLVVSLGGTFVGLLVCAWALVEGWRMVSAAARRRRSSGGRASIPC